ncbi:anthranilate synthase [Helicobacter pylori]
MNLSRQIFLATHKKDNSTKRHTNNLNNAQKFNLQKFNLIKRDFSHS